MKRILIVEDEFIIAQNLRQVLEGLGYDVAGHAFDADEALELMGNGGVDLAILDINLRHGLNGIELGRRLREDYGIPIVFLTSHTDSGTIGQAAAMGPSGYLVKPFNPAEIHACIEIALARVAPVEPSPSALMVKVGSSHVRLSMADILYLKSDRVYVEIHRRNGPVVLVRESLNAWEERLPTEFLRVSRSYIVRVSAIAEVHTHSIIVAGMEIHVTKVTKDEILERMALRGDR